MKKLIVLTLSVMMTVASPAVYAMEKENPGCQALEGGSAKFFSDFKTNGEKIKLNDEQMREIQNLRTQIWAASEKLIDEYVRLGLIDEESAAKIKSDKEHGRERHKQGGRKSGEDKPKAKAGADKFSTLTDAEKENIYRLAENIIILKKKLLDYEVSCGVKTSDVADEIKVKLDESFKGIKENLRLRFIR